jgi:hypothetical protein
MQDRAARELYYTIGEQAFFRLCWEKAVAFIRSYPGQYARLCLKRAASFWLGANWKGGESRATMKTDVSLGITKRLAYIAPTVLALCGLVVAVRHRRQVWPLVGQMFAYSVPHVLVYCGMPRYRFPIHGSLVLLVSVAALAACQCVGRRRWVQGAFHWVRPGGR